jgi:hypothetical protein
VCINLDSFKFYVIASGAFEKRLNSSHTVGGERVTEMDVLFSRITAIAKITSKRIAVYVSPTALSRGETTKISLF